MDSSTTYLIARKRGANLSHKSLVLASSMSLSIDGDPSKRLVAALLGSTSPVKSTGKKLYRQPQHSWLTLQTKRYLIIGLALFNVGLMVLTLQRGQMARLSDLHSVQALVAPTVLAQEVSIQPVKAPTGIKTSVTTEVVVQPTPVKAVAAVSVNRGNWDGLLQQYFGTAWQQAKRVMLCESGGNASAYNPSGATGLMQIMAMPGRPSITWLMVPENNIAYAAQLYRASGWRPWVCQPY